MDAPLVNRGCVLSDVRMPGMDGIELLRAFCRRGSRLPLLVMTGHADVSMAVEAMKAGAMDFIEKPFADGALLSVVRSGLHASDVQPIRDAEVEGARTLLAALSAREREVLDAVSEGKASTTLAD